MYSTSSLLVFDDLWSTWYVPFALITVLSGNNIVLQEGEERPLNIFLEHLSLNGTLRLTLLLISNFHFCQII